MHSACVLLFVQLEMSANWGTEIHWNFEVLIQYVSKYKNKRVFRLTDQQYFFTTKDMSSIKKT